jgi:hypothetical protein
MILYLRRTCFLYKHAHLILYSEVQKIMLTFGTPKLESQDHEAISSVDLVNPKAAIIGIRGLQDYDDSLVSLWVPINISTSPKKCGLCCKILKNRVNNRDFFPIL